MLNDYWVFTGRPNAGKSSLIRELVGLDVATGKHPGTTRRISQHPLNSGLVLVDMPGFGRIMGVSERFENMRKNQVIRFFESNAPNIALAIHVLDISTFRETSWRLEKKGILSLDVELIQFLAKTLHEFPLVAANKIDKTDTTELEAALNEFKHRISHGHSSAVAGNVFPVSVKTAEGLSALKTAIHEKLVARGYRTPFKVQ